MFPIEIKIGKGKTILLETDEGLSKVSKEGLAKLKPLVKDGTLTFGTQTHPADGNCGVIMCNEATAKELSTDKNITVQVLSYGYARAEKAHMAMAILPAAEMAMTRAGVTVKDCKVVKNHNPFVSNDIYLANTLNLDVMKFNNYACSLVHGHPQAPTAGRAIIEMIEELALLGGGYGLFTGCAAGDTGAAMVVKVS
jgi:acetyl-CoA acetyltransferase